MSSTKPPESSDDPLLGFGTLDEMKKAVLSINAEKHRLAGTPMGFIPKDAEIKVEKWPPV